MALDTYANLQAEIADWLNRQDLTAKIPTFIKLLEAQVNRKLRVHQMLARSQATVSTEYTALPSDFKALYNAQVLTTPVTPLEYSTPSELTLRRAQYTNNVPRFYSIVGSSLELAPIPDQAYTVEIAYWAAIPALSSTNTTNWLLQEYPDVYLYGSLMQAAPYLENDERIQVWGSALAGILEEIQIADERATKGGVPLKARIRPYV